MSNRCSKAARFLEGCDQIRNKGLIRAVAMGLKMAWDYTDIWWKTFEPAEHQDKQTAQA